MLLEKIEAWAQECPERIAHVHRKSLMTYGELKQSSDSLSVWIHETYEANGIPRQTPIIVYGHKENEMLVAFLAAVKAGNPYVPVDISVPEARVNQIIRASGARLVISPQGIPAGVKAEVPGLLFQENISLSAPGIAYPSAPTGTVPEEK